MPAVAEHAASPVGFATESFWVSQISDMRKYSNPYLQTFSEMEHLTYTAHGPHSDILLLFLNNFLRIALFLCYYKAMTMFSKAF